MIKIRKSKSRGLAEHGWLKSYHTFSFAQYYDENFMGFGSLRVINEDRIKGGTGFGTHSHRDMEIISYVIEGGLAHKDSMGNEVIIKPGEVQRLSAGTGIRHSEHNEFKDKTSHFLQIWIVPEKEGIEPSYGQKSFTGFLDSNDLILVASKSGKDGSITINQDVDMYVCKSQADGEKQLTGLMARKVWVQVITGDIDVNGEKLTQGDGAAIEKEDVIALKWKKGTECILINMAP